MSKVAYEEVRALKESGIFDSDWYLSEYPDVQHLNMDPAEHYLWIGRGMGRAPNRGYSNPNGRVEVEADNVAEERQTSLHTLLKSRNLARSADGFDPRS